MPRVPSKQTQKKSCVYLGIDPGTAYTGLSVMKKSANGKVRLLYIKTITTSSKMTTRERFDRIRLNIRELIEEYKVERVICEAFEVRPWEKPRSKAAQMSKLINDISEEVYGLRVPFLLSSPDIKKYYGDENLMDDIGSQLPEKKIPYFKHCKDAMKHLLYQMGRGN